MRGAAGQPTRPYVLSLINAGTTLRLTIGSLDFDDALEAPSTLTYRIDNLTDALNLVPTTSIPTPGTETTLTIAASVNVMSYNWRDTQLNQVTFTATYADGSQVVEVICYEVCAVAQAVAQ